MPVKRARKYSEPSSVINFRITPGTKALLTQSARVHGRTVSSEAELQLRRALSDWGNSQTNAIMTLIGQAIDTMVGARDVSALGKPARRSVKWWADPYLYAQAEHLVIVALRMFRPRGVTPDVDPMRADFALNATVREMQMVDETVPFEKQKPRQRRMKRLRQDLGLLADRPAPFGLNAAEERNKTD